MSFLEGFFLQASLIFVFGAQNVFILNIGLKKEGAFTVALVSGFCDALLVGVGIWGTATLYQQFSSLRGVLGGVGVLFLFSYGGAKVFLNQKTEIQTRISVPEKNTLSLVLRSMGFSLLNPHAILDTIVLVGGVFCSIFLF